VKNAKMKFVVNIDNKNILYGNVLN